MINYDQIEKAFGRFKYTLDYIFSDDTLETLARYFPSLHDLSSHNDDVKDE